MAARKQNWHDGATREKIRASQLVNRLQSFALSEGDVELDAPRIKAIEILLRKVLPDLQATTISGDPLNPLHLKPDLSGVSSEHLRILASLKLGE